QKPLMKESVESQFDENASLYQNVMKPIFDGKCTSCHNPNKLKGELDLSTIQGIKKGGKNGLVIDLNKLDSSPLIEKIHLPEENKKHMPPQGKPQLSNDEKALLEIWIARGADFEKKWKEYDSKDSLYMAAQKIISSTKSEQSNYDFNAASSTLISSLNDPFTTINPLNQNTPALHADFYVRAQYNPKKLIEFQKIKEQLVELNMGNMPVEDAEIKNIINFFNLEKLILNNSNITDNAVTELVKLPVLKSLALSGTGVTKKSLPVLQSSKSLKEVFIWNTSITAQDIDTNSTIFFYTGYVPDTSEKQALNSPAIRNESTVIDPKDSVTLYHRIPGVIIRYTLNDSLPDTFSSAIYERPLSMSRHTTVKARAMKEGWMASPVSSFSFFQKGIKPLHSNLLIAPNEKYRAQGSASLTDDVKGNIGNLIDGNWLGFRENPFEAIFEFDTITSLNEVILSINKSVGSYLVQPAYIEVFSGNDSTQMKLIKKIIPAPLTENEKGVSKNEAIEIMLDGSRAKYFMIKAMNNPKLPKWHSGKGQKGWLFVDEVFFY
ncbi:MAG: FN3 associated domain-containing protein, partial [Saprospiraceae bacterium]